MKIQSLTHGISTGMSIIRDFQAFDQRQKAEVANIQRQGLMMSPERAKEMSDKLEVQRMAAEKQLQMLKDGYTEFLVKDSLPFGLMDDNTPSSFSAQELRFIDSLRALKPGPETYQGYIKTFMANDRKELALALVNMATADGYKVTGIDQRSAQEKQAEFNEIVDKMALQLKPEEWKQDSFNKTTASLYWEQVERAYARAKTARLDVDGISVIEPGDIPVDAFGLPVEKTEQKLTPEEEKKEEKEARAFLEEFAPDELRMDDQATAVAMAQSARRANAGFEAERARAEAEERALVRAKIQSDVNAELEAKAQAEAKAEAERKAEIQQAHKEAHREKVLPEWAREND